MTSGYDPWDYDFLESTDTQVQRADTLITSCETQLSVVSLSTQNDPSNQSLQIPCPR